MLCFYFILMENMLMSNFNQDFEEMKRKKIKRLIIGYVVGFMVFLMMWNFYNAMRLKNYTENLKDTISFKIDKLQSVDSHMKRLSYMDKNGINVLVPPYFDTIIKIKEGDVLISGKCKLSKDKTYKFANLKKEDGNMGIIYPYEKEVKFSSGQYCDAIFVANKETEKTKS